MKSEYNEPLDGISDGVLKSMTTINDILGKRSEMLFPGNPCMDDIIKFKQFIKSIPEDSHFYCKLNRLCFMHGFPIDPTENLGDTKYWKECYMEIDDDCFETQIFLNSINADGYYYLHRSFNIHEFIEALKNQEIVLKDSYTHIENRRVISDVVGGFEITHEFQELVIDPRYDRIIN